MNEHESDVMALLQRMQQQLTFLEKKLDTLLQQSQQSQSKPFARPERTFSKPFRPYGGPHPSGGHGHGRPTYGDRPRQGSFAPKKKPYFNQGKNQPR
jgi:hypothetical protein